MPLPTGDMWPIERDFYITNGVVTVGPPPIAPNPITPLPVAGRVSQLALENQFVENKGPIYLSLSGDAFRAPTRRWGRVSQFAVEIQFAPAGATQTITPVAQGLRLRTQAPAGVTVGGQVRPSPVALVLSIPTPASVTGAATPGLPEVLEPGGRITQPGVAMGRITFPGVEAGTFGQ